MSKAEAKRFDAPDEVRPTTVFLPQAGTVCLTVRVTRSTGFRRSRLTNLVSRSLLSLCCAATASLTIHCQDLHVTMWTYNCAYLNTSAVVDGRSGDPASMC